MNRDQLNQSNATNILGPGKASKARLSNHNTSLGDYVDSLKITVDSYAAMIALCIGPKPIDFLVKVDENKGGQLRTTYQYSMDANGNRFLQWMASVPEPL